MRCVLCTWNLDELTLVHVHVELSVPWLFDRVMLADTCLSLKHCKMVVWRLCLPRQCRAFHMLRLHLILPFTPLLSTNVFTGLVQMLLMDLVHHLSAAMLPFY